MSFVAPAKPNTARRLGKHQIAKEGWTIVATDDLTVQPVTGVEAGKPASYSEAAQALRKLKQDEPGESRPLEDPSSYRSCGKLIAVKGIGYG